MKGIILFRTQKAKSEISRLRSKWQ